MTPRSDLAMRPASRDGQLPVQVQPRRMTVPVQARPSINALVSRDGGGIEAVDANDERKNDIGDDGQPETQPQCRDNRTDGIDGVDLGQFHPAMQANGNQ